MRRHDDDDEQDRYPQIDPRRLDDYRFPQPWTQDLSAPHWNAGQPWGPGEPWNMGRRWNPNPEMQRERDRAGAYGYGQMAWPSTDPGPRPSFRGKGPKGYQRPDERILDDLNERLTYDPLVDASDIECQVQNGEVTLLGNVSSREAKRRAEDIAETVLGAKEIHNAIRVRREGEREEELRWGAPSASHPASGARSVQGGKQPR